MIKRLRIRFVAAAMLSLFIVLAVIMVSINILNYRSIVKEADETLLLLSFNDGKFPIRNSYSSAPPIPYEFDNRIRRLPGEAFPNMSPELPYESRFFSVMIDNEGEVISLDTEHIAAIDEDSAVELAKKVLKSKKPSGFTESYRYIVSESEYSVRVIFLDCTRPLSTFYTFLLASCSISFSGLIAVFILMALLSGKIVKPISESYEKQRRFVADAGHEFKTPITIIDADAEVLEMDMPDNEWLSDIRKQAKRLTSLTNDLIYLSGIEENQAMLTAIEFPFSDMVVEAAQSFRPLVKTRNKEFILDIEPMLTVKGDEKALRQLVSILLDNALKYSSSESQIKVVLQRQGKTVHLTVTNETEYISKSDILHMFDRFYRADKSRNSETGGSGIGLSVAKAIVDAHKGKISAASADGASLTITVVLPE